MESVNSSPQQLSIYIPRVFKNVTDKFISSIFEDLKFGKVKHIDIIDKMDKNGNIYHSAYIHFDFWYDNIACKNFQERVQNPEKEARIVYKDPWFWVCLENNSSNKKNIAEATSPGRGERKIRIGLDNVFNGAKSITKIKNLYEEKEDDEKQKINMMNYVRELEQINYKLMYDLRNIQGDFIMA
jgi:hypothetical protein